VPKYLGDDMTLLLGLTDTRAVEMVKEENQFGTTPFYSQEKWNPNIRTGNRLIWARCWGIPIAAWDIANIRKIVSAIGDLVDIDDDAEERRRLDRARVLIRTPWRPTIQHLVNLPIGGEMHQVHIVEKTSKDIRRCTCDGRSCLGSSEEISSFDDDWLISNPASGLDIDNASAWINDDPSVGGKTSGNTPLTGVIVPNGTNTAVGPVGINPGTRKSPKINLSEVSGVEAQKGTMSEACPVLVTGGSCDKEERIRAGREPRDQNMEEQPMTGDLHPSGNVDSTRCQHQNRDDKSNGSQLAVLNDPHDPSGTCRDFQSSAGCNGDDALCVAVNGPLNLGLTNNTPSPKATPCLCSSPIEKLIKTPGPQQLKEVYNVTHPLALRAANNGPSNVGLADITNAKVTS